MLFRKYRALLPLLLVASIFISSNAFSGTQVHCPTQFKKLGAGTVQVPDGWCWAPNEGSTTACSKVINLKKYGITSMTFNAAMWTKTLKGPVLPKSALCYYGTNKYVLYSLAKFQQHPTGGSWQKVTFIGYACESTSSNDCPF